MLFGARRLLETMALACASFDPLAAHCEPSETKSAAAQQSSAPLDSLPGAPPAPQDEGLRKQLAAVDPLQDGWQTEAYNDRIGKQWGAIGALLHALPADASGVPATLLADDFRCSALRPDALDEVHADADFRVLRWRPQTAPQDPATAESAALSGPEGLLVALRACATALGADAYAKFKTIHVDEQPLGFRTTAYFMGEGRAPEGLVQQNATWIVHWVQRAEGEAPRIARIELSAFEEVRAREPRGSLFEDGAAAILGGNPSYAQQLVPSLMHWRAQLDQSLGLPILGHAAGIAIGDADGNGLEDLYLCQPGGLPNLLYLRQADGSARDASAGSGTDFLDFTRSALFADLDRDGDDDLIAVILDDIVFLENVSNQTSDGTSETVQPRFERRARFTAPVTTSLALADIEGDGDLDLYACAYMNPYDGEAIPAPYHDARNGQPNTFLRNDGEWRFSDATAELGFDHNNDRFSFSAAFEDYDRDGDLDLYVANDFGRNNLYRADAGRYRDVAAEAGVEDPSAGMGVAWADYDNDGWVDLHVSNMFSSAGNRVTFQQRFLPEVTPTQRDEFQRHARGNALFRNLGNGTFEDVSVASGVTMGRWAWGGLFVDWNNDGWQDVLVPNGFVTEPRKDDL
jgi:hypothetical protein